MTYLSLRISQAGLFFRLISGGFLSLRVILQTGVAASPGYKSGRDGTLTPVALEDPSIPDRHDFEDAVAVCSQF